MTPNWFRNHWSAVVIVAAVVTFWVCFLIVTAYGQQPSDLKFPLCDQVVDGEFCWSIGDLQWGRSDGRFLVLQCYKHQGIIIDCLPQCVINKAKDLVECQMYVEQKTDGEVTPSKTSRNVFLRMRDLINERGWCQHEVQDKNGRVCLVGAYDLVAGVTFTDHGVTVNEDFELTDTFQDSAYWKLGEATDWSVPKWNDAPGRTQAEVIVLLERLARE